VRLRSLWPIMLALPGLWAQQPRSLTLAEARRLAVQNNPHISAARSAAQASHQVPLQFRAGLGPSFTGAATGVGADSGSRLAAGGLNNPAVYSRIAAGVAVSQLITDFGRTRGLVAAADLTAQAQDQVAEASQADIVLSTVRAYFGLERAVAILQVAESTVTARRLVSDQVTALFNGKLKSQLDVSFANVNLAAAQLLLSQARNDVKAGEAALANALGIPTETSFLLAGEAMPEALPDNPDQLVRQALQDRPEIRDLRLEQSAAERFARAEHALNYPTISAAGVTGIVPAGEAAVATRYGAAGINVSIPIFNGGLYRARQSEAELKARAASDRVSDLANRITLDVRVAYLNARTAFERVSLTGQLLTQARLSLDLAQGRYDLGLGSIVELSQAQLNLTSAQLAETAARYDFQALREVVNYQIGAMR
jgi:outer membrane protein